MFTRVILNLGTAADNIPSTIQLNTQGEPYDIIERQTIINGVTYNIVFVARTSSDKTASDVAIIPEFSQPIFSYFGFNRQAIGLIIVN